MWNDPRTNHEWIVERVTDDGQWVTVKAFGLEGDARAYAKEEAAIFFDDIFRIRYR